jgi:GT2 family glycosyltransferase
MQEDPLVEARENVQRAQSDVQEAAISTHLTEALGEIAAALDRLEKREKRCAETQRNLAVQQALLDARLLRVERNRLFTVFNRIVAGGLSFSRRVRDALPNRLIHRERTPTAGEQKDLSAAYSKWVAHETAALPSVEHARAVSDEWPQKPMISVVMSVRSGESMSESLDSLRRQVYPNWELCIAAHPSCESRILPLIRDFEAVCRPVRYVATQEGISDGSALNAAASLATGEYLSIIEEFGVLSPFALHYIVEALQRGAFDALYSDEDTLDARGCRTRPIFKPDWSPDLLTSCMYMGHFLTVRRQRFSQCGGLSSEYGGAYLLDLVLRLTEYPSHVHHIRRVLYHSFPGGALAKVADETASASRAITEAISRREQSRAYCVPGPKPGTFMVMVRRGGLAKEMTAIICTRSPGLVGTCLESLRATAAKVVRQIIVVVHEESGPNPSLRSVIDQAGATILPFSGTFNFATMNNLGAAVADTANLLFLNDDVEATTVEWSEMLSEQVSRPEIGVAGAVLRYPSGTLQHAGVVVGIGDGVGHVGRDMSSSDLWPWLFATRNVSAVTGACLAIRKELYTELGGFDTGFPNNYNDVDLCFRVRERGYSVICVPVSGLVHAECQSRAGIVTFEERYRFYTRWADLLSRSDPYYSPSLSPTEEVSLNLTGDQWYRRLLVRTHSTEL